MEDNKIITTYCAECGGKAVFPTGTLARSTAESFTRQSARCRGIHGSTYLAYPCKNGRDWHVGFPVRAAL